ncbi:MAG: hypothetical protein PHI63_04565 [Patescibacteria group bacterium]|nr:hypothetical protein [Patescibacteria group bacterium]
MQLEKDLWIERGYYVDFDEHRQFRIIGPNNHLYCGLVDIPRHRMVITTVAAPTDAAVTVSGRFLGPALNLYYPVMDDIRTVRVLAGADTFLVARQKNLDRLVPQHAVRTQREGKTTLEFTRTYAERYWYRCRFTFPAAVTVKKITRPFTGFRVMSRTTRGAIPFTITAETNDLAIHRPLPHYFLKDADELPFDLFGARQKIIRAFWERTAVEIEHLIAWGKTSGDRFGTIFPRDWMEAADIGVHDLTPEARGAMYQASLRHVNAKGEGWHEDVVGEYKYEYQMSGRDIYDRHMIDIEPHYLIGLQRLPQEFLLDADVRRTLQRVARYVIAQARSKEFITFKKLPAKDRRAGNRYYVSGNWRDSEWAFKKVGEDIAPFDVNAVFYPKALAVLKELHRSLQVPAGDLDQLIAQWQTREQAFRFANKDGTPAYALAVHHITGRGKNLRFSQLKVNHLDESYFYTYGQAGKGRIASFCHRLLDPRYFATAYGPLLIARDNDHGYTNAEYHGQVIWMKQAAFTILGLSKHLKIAVLEHWPAELQQLIKRAMLQVAGGVIDACVKLNAIPELHWVDGTTPKFFPVSSSKVQLWSAVGIRRIIRKYMELHTDPVYRRIKASPPKR